MIEKEEIVSAIMSEQFRITDHAYEEVLTSVIHGEIIERYPKDKPYPSGLIFGENFRREPIHSVWAYNREKLWAVVITVYRPDPERWIEFKTRRTKQ